MREAVRDDVSFVTFGEFKVATDRPNDQGEEGGLTGGGALFCSAFVIKPE